MAETAFQTWRTASGVIHDEMDRLIRSRWPDTVEDRQVRKIQYMALIERRDAAARDFLRREPEFHQRLAGGGP
jgi:hypothetical protein